MRHRIRSWLRRLGYDVIHYPQSTAYQNHLRNLLATEGSATGRMVRLHYVYPDHVRPGERVFLKIDTQGWDAEVLTGAGDRLEEVLGLQLELSLKHTYEGQPDYLELLSTLRERG